MGLEVDSTTLAHYFEPGDGEPDPSLLWFVDLRCDGAVVPDTYPESRRWLADHGPLVTSAFQGLAEKLEVGLDPDVWPVEWPVPGTPAGLRMTVVCSCIRRVTARKMGSILKDIANRWQSYLDQLDSVASISK